VSGAQTSAGPLWCLHGALGEAADWRGLAGRLAVQGRVVRAVDLWRFLACRPMGLKQFGSALNEEARAEGGQGKVLLGYSMGGRLALHALLDRRPGPWVAAVIVSAHPGLEDEEQRAKRRGSDADWAAKALRGDWAAMLNEWNTQPVLAGGPAPDRGALVGRRQMVARSFIDWSLGGQEPLWDRLVEMRLPVLWVAGARDRKFVGLAERAVGMLPEAELWLADGAGHRVPWQADEAFAGRVLEFLEQLPS
jgi:2-succinyl-6-hydroxy-2,4-cyclohexadiene-1-carboxylate synthase